MKNPKPVVFLKGRKVILRPLRKSTDLESCLRWINDPEVSRYLAVFWPMTEREEGEWFDNLGRDKNNLSLAIETRGGVFIGVIGLHQISWKDGVATTGALIGEKKYWGKGFGTDAKMFLLNYAFNTLGLRKICSSVRAFNERSLRYSLRCGYRKEGRRVRQHFVEGQYWDEILLAVFKKDWLPLWLKYQKTGSVR